MTNTEQQFTDLRIQSLREAEEIFEKIKEAYQNPEISLSGKSQEIHSFLREFNWFDDFSIHEDKNSFMFKRLIAMAVFYSNQNSAPSKEKQQGESKWEVVMKAMNKA